MIHAFVTPPLTPAQRAPPTPLRDPPHNRTRIASNPAPPRMQQRGRQDPPRQMTTYQPSEQPSYVRLIPGTPLTYTISRSPMPDHERNYYIQLAVRALSAALDDNIGPVLDLTLLLPNLDPSSDVYDRRFLLRLAWSILTHLAFPSSPSKSPHNVRVLVQSATKYNGLPLSVYGLKPAFDDDLRASRDQFPDADWSRIRTGEIGPDSISSDDDIFLVLSPTNTISAPVINDFMEMMNVVQGRPVIVLNGRMKDVPSHSGVMQVKGRAERAQFLDTFQIPFYFKLLYTSGTTYPIRGALFRAYPGNFMLYKKVDGENGEAYKLIGQFPDKPSTGDVTMCFQNAAYEGQNASELPPAFSAALLAAIALIGAVVAATSTGMPSGILPK